MRFLDKLVLKQNLDIKLMITEIICSMLESTPTSDDEETSKGVSKSTHL